MEGGGVRGRGWLWLRRAVARTGSTRREERDVETGGGASQGRAVTAGQADNNLAADEERNFILPCYTFALIIWSRFLALRPAPSSPDSSSGGMSVVMAITFGSVCFLQSIVVFFHCLATAASPIRRLGWLSPGVIWILTSCWMLLCTAYIAYINTARYHPWMCAFTCAMVLANGILTLIVRAYSHRSREHAFVR